MLFFQHHQFKPEHKFSFILRPQVISALFILVMSLHFQTAQAQDREQCQEEVDIAGNNDSKSKRKKRRRPGGVNRDCKRKQVEIDVETGEVNVVEKASIIQQPRVYLSRKQSTIPKPQVDDFKALTPIPDRWRIVNALGYQERWFDPYNQNVFKADKPIHGDDWFLNLDMISDTVYENRETLRNGSEVLPLSEHHFFNQNLAFGLTYYKGNTTFKPPDYQFRFMPVLNYNHSELNNDRSDNHAGIQALYAQKHIRDVSSNYDFDAVRVGIQPFSSDYRGHLFLDSPFGVRFFGTRNNNKYQYNIGLFRRLKKAQNSGLNDAQLSFKDDDVFVANLYLQDRPKAGFSSQFSLLHNRNSENQRLINTDPRSYDVTYLGYNGEGHWGRLNLSTSIYYAFGNESRGVFNQQLSDISAYYMASEFSIDFDWIRLKASVVYGSGDDDTVDDQANGFDAIDSRPQLAGGDASYWFRQPNGVTIMGAGFMLSSRNGLLNSLRTSPINSQANFTNPGTTLLGLGADFEILPELSIAINTNYIQVNKIAPLAYLSQASILSKNMGLDASIAAVYRPMNSQNIIVRLSYAKLFSGKGFKQLFGGSNPDALLLNVILTY